MLSRLDRRPFVRLHGLAAVPVLMLVLGAGCSSGGDEVEPEEALATARSTADSSSAPLDATPSPSGSTAAPLDTPSATPTPAFTTTPTPTPTPTSRFERDPAVQGLRAYFAVAAEAINTGNEDHPGFKNVSMPGWLPDSAGLVRSQKGLRAPGPTPFTPLRVKVLSSVARDVEVCGMDNGWNIDPSTGKPKGKKSVIPAVVHMVKQGSRWKVDSVYSADFSCKGVKVP